MGKGILEQLEETLALENNNRYGQAVDTLNDSSSEPKKREKAKKTIIKIVAEKFRKDKRLNGYLSETNRNIIEKELKPLENGENISDNDFYRAVSIVEDKCYFALMHYYLNDMIILVHGMAKKISCTTAHMELANVKRSDSAAKKKSTIRSAINEMLVFVRQRAHINSDNRKVSENMKNRLEILINMTRDISDRLETKDKIDYWILRDDVVDLMEREYKAYKMIEKKIETPLGEDEKLDKDKKRGKNMENEKNSKALVPYEQPKPLALQREEVKGTTDKPPVEPEKTKKNHKKIYMWIAGVLVAVTLIGGAYFLGTKTADKDEDHKPGYEQDVTEDQIAEAATAVHANWSNHGIEYTKEEVTEIIKALNGQPSTMTIDEADDALMTVLNTAIVPGVNNVLNGESNETKELDFSSLIVGTPDGYKAVEKMEDNLNGCLTDPDNLLSYCEAAFVDEALIIGEGDSVDGMSAQEGTTTPAGVRIIWSRLALGTNAFAGTLGDQLSAEVEGKTYLQSDLNDGVAINNIATAAKKELGSIDKQMTLN